MSEAASSRKNMSQPAPSIGGPVAPEYRPLPVEHRPVGYVPPFGVRRLLECGLVDWEPWTVCHGEWLVGLHRLTRQSYPSWNAVPIAKRGDNDDTACWVVADGSVVVLHLGADESALVRGRFPTLWHFLDAMYRDFVERAREDEEWEAAHLPSVPVDPR